MVDSFSRIVLPMTVEEVRRWDARPSRRRNNWGILTWLDSFHKSYASTISLSCIRSLRGASKKQLEILASKSWKINHIRMRQALVSIRKRFITWAGPFPSLAIWLLHPWNPCSTKYSKCPRALAAVAPKSAMKCDEEAWNAYPDCKTGKGHRWFRRWKSHEDTFLIGVAL